MSRFDNTVNTLLNRLLFEQKEEEQFSDEQLQEASRVINETREEIKKEIETNSDAFFEKAEANVNAYDYAVDSFVNSVKELYTKHKNMPKEEPLNEEASSGPDALQDITSKVSNFTWDIIKKGGSFIGGAFEDGLDYMTDLLVDYTPALLKGAVGEQNYNDVRKQVEEWDDYFLYKIAAILDPSGVLSWTYLEEARKLYEQNLGKEDEDIYTLNLLAATVAVIPGVSALKIFTLPFKILFSPLRALLGGARASAVARSVAKELKTTFNIGQRLDRAATIASRSGRIGEKALNLARKITAPVKPIARLTASAAKAATITSGGDIPAMVSGWMEKGAKMVDQIPQQKTLGRMPSFQRITTQP